MEIIVRTADVLSEPSDLAMLASFDDEPLPIEVAKLLEPAGAISAGAFLATFVGDYPFVHLDIASTAWVDRPAKSYETQGGTGVGVRLLTEYLRGHTQ